jgi:hypothetical protein
LTRRTSRLAAGLVVALLLPLAGCGDPTADYCSALKEHNKDIAEMIGSDSPAALLSGLPTLRDLAEKAPEDLTDEWQTFLGALDGLAGAIKDAGVKPSDFKGGRPPNGISASQQKAISEAANQVGADDVVQASSGIEQQARDVCKVNLGLS